MTDAKDRATAIVSGLGEGSAGAPGRAEELLPLVYDELRALARGYMARERAGHTLQPTALVHEAYMKLVDQSRVDWQGRTHFLAVCAVSMRRILIDHARGHKRAKRGDGRQRVTLAHAVVGSHDAGVDPEQLLDLDTAVDKLAKLDPRQARIVELRCFGGLTVAEVAHVLGVSKRTVEGDWTHALAWLTRELTDRNPT